MFSNNYYIVYVFSIVFFNFNITESFSATQATVSEKGILSVPNTFLNSPFSTSNELLMRMNPSLTKLKRIQSNIKKALVDLKNGEKKKGLEKLNQAWRMNPAVPVAGVIIVNVYLNDEEYKTALNVALEIQHKSPKVVEGYLLAGIAYAGLDNKKQMKASFEKALDVQPGNIDAGFNLADFFLKQGNITQAEKILSNLLLYNPDDLKVVSSLAKLELNGGDSKKAIILLEALIDKHSEELQPRVLLAQIFIEINDTAKALIILDNALEKFPNNVELMEYIAVVQMKRGEIGEAIIMLESAIKLSSNKHSLYYNSALNYEKSNQFPLAIEAINKALKLNSSHASYKFVLARLMVKTGKHKVAKKLLKELDSLIPESANVSDLKGRISFAENKVEEAITHFKSAIEKNANDPFLIAKLSMAQFKANKNDAGYETLYHWINTHPNDISIRFIIADRLLDNGGYAEAQKYYREIIKIQPESLVASNNIAWILAETGHLENALDLAEENYAKAAENVFVIDTLATILLKKGEIKKSISLLEKATKIAPNNTTVSYHLAQAFAGQDNAKAKIILTNLLSNNKFFKERELSEELLLKLN